MRLLLFSGFLGSGKTTLVLRVVKQLLDEGKKAAILVNEIGEVGIDNQLMRKLDMNVWELLNGCICCTLTADLVSTLQQLDTDYSPDVVVIEPSGAADPRAIHTALPYYQGTPLESIQTISVLDPLRIEFLIEVMTPLITSQLKNADLVVISKCDQATPEEIAYAHQTVREYNSQAKILEYSIATPLDTLMNEIK